jgi:hypothetical protein
MIITVYKKSNGEIVKTCVCFEQDILFQYDALAEDYIEGSFDYKEYYIQDNNAVLIPQAPNEYCIFNYDTKQWFDPRTNETQSILVKSQRNMLLAASDWTQFTDVFLANKEEWAVYRQGLRDITIQSGYPFNVVWPTKPQG